MNGLLGYPAASMNGDVFVMAAQNAGLGTDIDTLNKIVNLVNQGVNPDQAAQYIAQSSGSSVSQQQMPQSQMQQPLNQQSMDQIIKSLSAGLLRKING
jgi:hypothetical protein